MFLGRSEPLDWPAAGSESRQVRHAASLLEEPTGYSRHPNKPAIPVLGGLMYHRKSSASRWPMTTQYI